MTTNIGRGVVVRGTIRGDDEIVIEGRIEGTLDVAGDVTVESTGRVQAPVNGHRITVHGAVAGAMSGSIAIVLEDGARVVGDLAAPSIGIRPGGLLRGHVSTEGGSAPRAARSAAAAPARRAPATPAVSAPMATQAPRAHRPASLAKARDEALGAAVTSPAPAARTARTETAEPARTSRSSATPRREGAPPPVVPSLKKGAKAAMKKKGGR